MLVLGATGLVAVASTGTHVQASRFFATPIKHEQSHRRTPPARMLVYAQEWSLWPSRTSVPAGRVTVQLWNRGEDSHDLRIQRLGAGGSLTGPAQGVAITRSGGVSHSTWKLKPGRYELYCSLPGHLQNGMHTTLVVH
jgi:plastocyanin